MFVGVFLSTSTTDGGVADLPRLAHHGQERLTVGLLVARQQRLRVLPAAGFRNVLERQVLSFRRPLSSIRVPQTSVQLWQLRFPLGHREPPIEQVSVHRLIG